MKLTKQQQLELLETAKPLIKWLNENCHPLCEITVTSTSVELLEGIAGHQTNEFVKD